MSDERINLDGVISVISDCVTCGCRYTVPQRMWDEQRKAGGFHYCPNGHNQGWSKDGCENAKLHRERDRLQQRLAEKDDDIRQLERSITAHKGQATKLKKRASAGVCSCCNRTFQNLARHMATKHPDIGKEKAA